MARKKRRRLKRSFKRNLCIAALLTAVLVTVSTMRRRAERLERQMTERVQTQMPERQYRYSRLFNDLNDVQMESARQLGTEPLENRSQATGRRLRQVESCRLYEVEPLTYSIPYLVPEAKKLLEDIGRGFRDSLARYSIEGFCPIVTSLTRTREDVDRLRRSGNVNATVNSCHCYGTTFDLAFTRFRKNRGREQGEYRSQLLKQVLAEAIENLHSQGRCYVKYESKQACFHITVRQPEK